MKKKLLHIIPYPIFPPKNGGMLRNYFLCIELSKYFEVTLIVLQDKESFINEKDAFGGNNDIRVLLPNSFKSSGLHKYWNALKGRYYQNNWKQSAGAFTLRIYPLVKKLLRQEAFDCVLFEHLSTTVLSPLVQKHLPHSLIIVDMHNIDHLLFNQENDLLKSENKWRFEKLRKQESNLVEVADIFFACSENDKNKLEAINGYSLKGFSIPNGVDSIRSAFDEYKDLILPNILFCGSLDYEPNIDGLRWFVQEVWPMVLHKNIHIQMTIIGRNPSAIHTQELNNIKNINFIGEVNEVDSFYQSNNICIVPVRKGSGTRLKILEAMSFGNSIVSTTIGAEGITISDKENIVIADDAENFAEAILQLISNPELNNTIRKNARALVEQKYSWGKIGVLAFSAIKKELNKVSN